MFGIASAECALTAMLSDARAHAINISAGPLAGARRLVATATISAMMHALAISMIGRNCCIRSNDRRLLVVVCPSAVHCE